MSIVIWNEVVAGKVNGVGTGNLEEDALVLTDGDVERLLPVLVDY